MKIILLAILLYTSIFTEELKIQANSVQTNQKDGVSIFEGDVRIKKGADELNASKITIYTDENNQPTQFISEGNSSFVLMTQDGATYKGKAQKVIYLPKVKEYHFYEDVHLQQTDEKKEITGEEVVLKIKDGKAYAKGAKKEPVIVIFELPEENTK